MLENYNIKTNVEGELGDKGPPPLPSGEYTLRLTGFAERTTQNRDVYVDLDFVVMTGPPGVMPGSKHRESLRVFASDGGAMWRTEKFFKAIVTALGHPAGTTPTDAHLRQLQTVTIDATIELQAAGKNKTTGKEYPARSQIERLGKPTGAASNTAPPQQMQQPMHNMAPPMNNMAPPMHNMGQQMQPGFQPAPQFPPQSMPQSTAMAPPAGYNNPPPAGYTPPPQQHFAPQAQPAGNLPSWMNNNGQ